MANNKSGAHVYIDGANLRRTLNILGYSSIDYVGLHDMLARKYKAKEFYIYDGYGNAKEKASHLKLESIGYNVHLKKIQRYPAEEERRQLKCPKCKETHEHTIIRQGKRKANCDSELTLDVIKDSARGDCSEVIVFSGDGDFSRMYLYVSETLGKAVTVYAPLGERAGDRTAASIKKLGKRQTINLQILESILGFKGYGVKQKEKGFPGAPFSNALT